MLTIQEGYNELPANPTPGSYQCTIDGAVIGHFEKLTSSSWLCWR